LIHPFIKSKLPELVNIFSRHKVKSVRLFGSACTDGFNENSDVDFLVEPGDESDPVIKGEILWDLYFELQDFLNRKIDLVTRDSMKNSYFIEEVDRTSIAIYG
jgi:uncharacterized protein